MLRGILTGLVLLVTVAPAFAGDKVPVGVEKAIRGRLQGMKIDSIAPSPVPGLYQVSMGPQVFYVSGDGRYALQGDLLDLADHSNLTEKAQAGARAAAIEAIGEKNMIIYSPPHPTRTITVFTDVDCPYCRKLHEHMPQMNALGLRVRYLFYPRAGFGSSSWHKAQAVWCSDDRKAALTAVKQGVSLPRPDCKTPVAMEYQLGQEIGISGTPTIITEKGHEINGYLPPAALLAEIRRLDGPDQPLGPRR
ncbi:MAG: DsbC family protein [Gammaproteobacteria bacterium]